ncbi:MAG: glucosamine-6-phosphate deaminase [Terrimesophilobacter sp.]
MPEIVIVGSAVEAGRIAASEIEKVVHAKTNAVLGLATGSTPLTTWAALAERSLDLSRVSGFALDEYVGLPKGHPESYRAVVDREVVDKLQLTPSLVHVPGEGGTLESAGARYEDAILAAGGIDLQLLGIGRNGHIGFNEPGASLASLSRVTLLTKQTRRDNARFFDSAAEVPTHAITQGLGTILRARRLVLVAFGAAKAPVIAAAIEGPLTTSVPASALQLHPHSMVIVDEAAASHLANTEYYREAWENHHRGELD